MKKSEMIINAVMESEEDNYSYQELLREYCPGDFGYTDYGRSCYDYGKCEKCWRRPVAGNKIQDWEVEPER